jgi:predicted TIM-barrel fold metal-dependent hydrolase
MSSRYSRREFIQSAGLASLAMALPRGLSAGMSIAGDPVYFDAFTQIGPRRYKHPAERWRLSELLEEMQHCSISGALVSSTMSVHYDPHLSNLQLSREIAGYPSLKAVWNIMPDNTGEFSSLDELKNQLKEHSVRAIMIHPLSNGWDWQAQHNQALFEFLSEQKLLTITTAQELGGWHHTEQFLASYPQIPLLLVHANWIEQRYLVPLVMRFPNLHICFDQFQINEGLEFFVKNGKDKQLLFGSSAPAMSMGAHRTYIDLADIPLSAKLAIAGGNLARLTGLPLPKPVVNKSEDALMKAIRNRQAPGVPIIDMHMHILDEGIHGAGGLGYRMENGGPSGVFKHIGKLGVKGGGIMSWNGVVSLDSIAGNKTTARALDMAPPGYWGLATVDPVHYSRNEMMNHIKAIYADKRFIGMKPYHFYGLEYHDKRYDDWWSYGNENRFYGLIHATRNDLVEIDTLAGKYKNARWIIAHACGSYKTTDMAIEVMQKHSNVYAEITLTPVHGGIIEYLRAGVGADRILYGSDLPMRDPRQQLGWLVFSRLPEHEKKQMLGSNAVKFLEPIIHRLPEKNRPKAV